MQILQVGIGGFGWSWTDILKKFPGIEIAGYVDVNKEILNKRYEVSKDDFSKFFNNLDKAIKNVKANTAIVVVPPKSHKDVVLKLLYAGYDVLVEKPLADKWDSSLEMVKVAKKLKKILMVSQNYRFRKNPRMIRKIVENKTLGNVGYVSVNFHKAPRFEGSFRLKMPEPLIRDMSIHHFDLMRYILGLNPISIYSKSFKANWSWFRGNPSVSSIVEFDGVGKDRVIVNYFASWISQGEETSWEGEWRIQCSNGAILWNQRGVFIADSSSVVPAQEGIHFRQFIMPFEDREYSLYEFLQSIKERKQPETNGEDNLKSLAMVFAAEKSYKKNKTVKLK